MPYSSSMSIWDVAGCDSQTKVSSRLQQRHVDLPDPIKSLISRASTTVSYRHPYHLSKNKLKTSKNKPLQGAPLLCFFDLQTNPPNPNQPTQTNHPLSPPQPSPKAPLVPHPVVLEVEGMEVELEQLPELHHVLSFLFKKRNGLFVLTKRKWKKKLWDGFRFGLDLVIVFSLGLV